MRIELLMKVVDFSKGDTGDRDEEDDHDNEAFLDRIIKGKTEEEIKFTYEPYVLDMRDIGVFGRDGAEHTKIMTPFGLYYAKINYSVFKHIYEAQLGTTIKTEKDFKIIRN